MNTKFIEKIKVYLKRRKKITLIFDVVFYLLIIALVIPSMRKSIGSLIIRGTLHQPIRLRTTESVILSGRDYNWQVESMEGDKMFLSEFQGKVVFLNFWATWCPPFITEMPSIQKSYNQLDNKVVFIIVS